MNFEWLLNPEWLLAIATVIAAVTAWRTQRWSRRRLKAETKSVTWDHVTSKLKYLEGEVGKVAHLEEELIKLREKITEYRDQLDDAIREIHSLRERVQVLHEFINDEGLVPPKEGEA